MYSNCYSRSNPGLIVFIVDQSANSLDVSVKVSDCINELFYELILQNTLPNEMCEIDVKF